MLTNHARIKFSVVFTLALVIFFAASALGQNRAKSDDPIKQLLSIQVKAWGETTDKQVVTEPPQEIVRTIVIPVPVATPELLAPAKKPVASSTPGDGDLEDDVAAIKAENAVVKEQLRRMEEGQRILIEQLNSLRRKMDRADASASGKPTLTMADVPDTDANASSGDAQAVTDPANTSAPTTPAKKKQGFAERYQDGMIIWKTPDDAQVPFMLRFNVVTQFRYLNTLDSDDT